MEEIKISTSCKKSTLIEQAGEYTGASSNSISWFLIIRSMNSIYTFKAVDSFSET